MRRHESDELRDLQAELTFIAALGTPEERVERIPFTVPRDTLRRRFRLTDAGGLVEVPIPANERR